MNRIKGLVLGILCSSIIFFYYTWNNHHNASNARVLLYVRLFADEAHVRPFYDLVASLDLYWPSLREGPHPGLLVVLDDESAADHALGQEILLRLGSRGVRVAYEPPPSSGVVHTGHARQQWSMFYADRHLRADETLVGFIDGDALLVTPMREELLREGGTPERRPKVKGILPGYEPNIFWRDVPANTQRWLGGAQRPEVFRGMAYFPVLVWRDDLPFIREWVRHAVGLPSFDDVFARLTAPPAYFSQFNIMLNVLYYARRERYDWRLQRSHPRDSDAAAPLPGQIDARNRDRLLEHAQEEVHGFLHMSYRPPLLAGLTSKEILALGGVCHVSGALAQALAFSYEEMTLVFNETRAREALRQYCHYY
jgi:hypothetical protein